MNAQSRQESESSRAMAILQVYYDSQSDDRYARRRGQLYCRSKHCSVTAVIIAQGK